MGERSLADKALQERLPFSRHINLMRRRANALFYVWRCKG